MNELPEIKVGVAPAAAVEVGDPPAGALPAGALVATVELGAGAAAPWRH